MHSIELLLDPTTDAAVRSDWADLAAAGLPSQARHTGATNAPHVTLLARLRLDGSHDDELGRVAEALPLPARLGGLVVFGPPRGLVLARLVVLTESILRLHSAVHDAVTATDDAGSEDEDAGHTRPGRWTPHVTLASRLTGPELAAAIEVLSDGHRSGPQESSFVGVRRWDSTLKTITAL